MSRAQHRRRDSGPFETRPFQEGDDEAWIDWAATAESGRMMVRVPSQAQHAEGAPGAAAGPRIDPRLVIVGASAIAVTALVAGVIVAGDGDGDAPVAPQATTAVTAPPPTSPGDPPDPPDAGDADANLIPNPSFEGGTRGWTAWRGLLRRQSVARAPDGRFVARVISTRGTAFTLSQRTPQPVDGVPAGSTLRGQVDVRAANRLSVGKVVVLRLRQRTPEGRVLAESAGRPVRLAERFAPVVVRGRLAEEGAVVDLRVSAESGWFGTRIAPKNAFDADGVNLRVVPD